MTVTFHPLLSPPGGRKKYKIKKNLNAGFKHLHVDLDHKQHPVFADSVKSWLVGTNTLKVCL